MNISKYWHKVKTLNRLVKKYRKNIKDIFKIIVYDQYIAFPFLWKKNCDHIGIQEKIAIKRVAEWAVRNRGKKNGQEAIKAIEESIRNRHSWDEKKILFVLEYPLSGRYIKMAKALSQKGYHIILLCSSVFVPNRADFHDEECFFDDIRSYNNVTQLLYYIIESRVPILHFFVGWDYFSTILFLLQIKGILPKIVVEKYDIFNGMYYPKIATKKRCRAERYFMENSDGVSTREYALEYCKNELGFHLKRQECVFLDYAEPFKLHRKDNNEEELSLCYVGGIVTELEHPDASEACFLDLAKMCEENRCHLHIYPARWDEDRFSQYISLSSSSDYFHFHRPVKFSELYKEISQYDYGIMPNRKTYLDKAIEGYVTRNKKIYAATNKFFDYISAGLPIIAVAPVRIVQEIEKSGGLLRWTLEEFNFDELRDKKAELREHIKKNREHWMIDNRIDDLIKYYDSVVSDM